MGGSVGIRRFIEHWSAQGLLIASLHGHIHEPPLVSGRDHTRIHQALCINPGQRDRLQFLLLELSEHQGAHRIRILPDLEKPACQPRV